MPKMPDLKKVSPTMAPSGSTTKQSIRSAIGASSSQLVQAPPTSDRRRLGTPRAREGVAMTSAVTGDPRWRGASPDEQEQEPCHELRAPSRAPPDLPA